MLLAELVVFGFTLRVVALFLAFLGGGLLDILEFLFLVSLSISFCVWLPVWNYLQSQLVIFA